MRGAIDDAIREVCTHRGWTLHALNVRTNHVHVVVSAPDVAPERVMNDFKAYATRRLRQRKLVSRQQKVWAHHGSTPRIWKPEGLARAIRYVNEAQGPELPML
ncbi:MAG: transposase [Planctomycetes bacterium]|nr:transposase [Planctomycetota bacterium]